MLVLTIVAVCGLVGMRVFDTGMQQAHEIEETTVSDSVDMTHSAAGPCGLGCGIDHLIDVADCVPAVPVSAVALAPELTAVNQPAGHVFLLRVSDLNGRDVGTRSLQELSISRT